jgi:hypothetical protein
MNLGQACSRQTDPPAYCVQSIAAAADDKIHRADFSPQFAQIA